MKSIFTEEELAVMAIALRHYLYQFEQRRIAEDGFILRDAVHALNRIRHLRSASEAAFDLDCMISRLGCPDGYGLPVLAKRRAA